jgi:hypothetical protein
MNRAFPLRIAHVPSGVVVEVDHFPVDAFQIRRLERLNAPPSAGVPKYVGENHPVPLGLIRMRWLTTLAVFATGTAN